MKPLVVVTAILLSLSTAGAAQVRECLQTQFSGEATQSTAFRQLLGDDVEFSVVPMHLKGTEWAWFNLVVIRRSADGIFAFHPSDLNWLLAVQNWNIVIGGANRDVRATLGDRSRYVLFPLSVYDLEPTRQASERIQSARTGKELRVAVAALERIPLAHAKFTITDYGVSPGKSPTRVDWVRFDVTVTLPKDFLIWGELPIDVVDCPAIPVQVLQDITDDASHRYRLRK